ncbi:MAG: hypothetical protein KDB03_05980 [Planctomycetales bacterium]|nr:hypothetical protein [Planctomycetales bacterium]
MFEQVYENLQKATEASVKAQQEMFQKWMDAFPSVSTMPTLPTDLVAQWKKKWEATYSDLLKQQQELVNQNYEAGIKALGDIFNVSDAKTPVEFQQKVTELYRKSFDSLRQLSETQLREFKSAAEKWSELMTGSKVG